MRAGLLAGAVLAMLVAVEAGSGGGGGNARGGDSKGGSAAKGGNADKGGKGGKGGSSGAGGAASGGKGGNSGNTGAAGSGGSSETTVGGTTYIFNNDNFGPGTEIGVGNSQQVQGGSGAAGGSSGASVAGKGGSGGKGGSSGNAGSGGRGGSSVGGSSTGGQSGKGGTNNGNGGTGGQGGTFQLALPPIPRRSVLDLFYRDLDVDYLHSRDVNSQLYARASPTAPKAGGAAAAAPAGGESEQITEADFISMINSRVQFPKVIEDKLAGSEIGKEYNIPKRGECPAKFKNHPATEALKLMSLAALPPNVKAALDNPANGWTKKGGKVATAGGTGAAAAAGGSSKAAAVAPGTAVKGGAAAAAPAKVKAGGKRDAYPDVYYDDSFLYSRYAEPEAYYEDNSLYARDAYAGAFFYGADDSELFGRDAYAAAGFWDEDSDLFERDFDDEYLYAREAEPEAEAFPEPKKHASTDGDVEEVDHVSFKEVQQLIHTLETSPQAQKAILKAVNADPYLAHITKQMEHDYE